LVDTVTADSQTTDEHAISIERQASGKENDPAHVGRVARAGSDSLRKGGSPCRTHIREEKVRHPSRRFPGETSAEIQS
jgi:hypothetical protein